MPLFIFDDFTERRLAFFFFQAEDGIRDATVTGVQTCALPIYFLRLLNVSIRGSQRRNAKQRRGKVGFGGKRRSECRFRLLWFAERAQRVADDGLERCLGIGTSEIRAAEFGDQLLRVSFVDQGSS